VQAQAEGAGIGLRRKPIYGWARQAGHDIEGREIVPDMVEAIRERAFTVHLAPVSASAFRPNSFDAIVAIDVLEHLSLDDLKDILRLAKTILKPVGSLIARFPNGASPFSLRSQSGDYTYVKPLSPSAMRQIAKPFSPISYVQVSPSAVSSEGGLRTTVWCRRSQVLACLINSDNE
jgi:2-polyprenyl-3-methyl-5-hydroxy-6-metoxy-1,4-benzoquinol methylase